MSCLSEVDTNVRSTVAQSSERANHTSATSGALAVQWNGTILATTWLSRQNAYCGWKSDATLVHKRDSCLLFLLMDFLASDTFI